MSEDAHFTPQQLEPVHPRVPLDGHYHRPGEHCRGCADLFAIDHAFDKATIATDDIIFLKSIGIKPL